LLLLDLLMLLGRRLQRRNVRQRRIREADARGGDCESRASGNAAELGELKEVGGAEPAEHTNTNSQGG
jgi:hypothetical protein